MTDSSVVSSKSQGALQALAAAHEQTTRVLEAAARDKVEREASPALRRGSTPITTTELRGKSTDDGYSTYIWLTVY